MRRRRRLEEEEPEAEIPLDLESFKGSVREFLALDGPNREVGRRFKNFMRSFVDDKNKAVYRQRIEDMCAGNKQSLEVSFPHLALADQQLSVWVWWW